jgi:arylformamidase
MSTDWHDITLPVRESLAVWPGDTPYAFTLGWKMSEGDSVNVGAVTMSVHTGTHADAPFHFEEQGASIDVLDPAVFVGPALVLDAAGYEVIPRSVFADVDGTRTPRVLLKTGAWIDHTRFPETVPIVAPDVPAFLAERGIVLLGVDVPSVDAIDSKDLPNHRALGSAGIAILESLDLRAVPPGEYDLIALPLRLAGADGSPVRAVLKRKDEV